jgi:AcrR family transcriptional regulator
MGQRTRVRLLQVATQAIAEDSEASMTQIARLAEVGIGTLYRHFPNRHALLCAIYDNELERLTGAADALLEVSAPLPALRGWLAMLAQCAATRQGLRDAFRAAAGPGGYHEIAYGPLTQAIEQLVAANRDGGTIRSDLTADDVLLAAAGLFQLDPATDWQATADRLIDIVIHGLRPRPGPGPPADDQNPQPTPPASAKA